MNNILLSAAGGPLFTLTSIDIKPLTDTLAANAPIIIPAAIGIILVKKAIPLVPAMVGKLIK